jgi:hypothetical protein
LSLTFPQIESHLETQWPSIIGAFGRSSPGCKTTDWSWPADKKIAAEKIRALLEGRIARLLGCDAADLHSMRIGSLAHFLFLLIGDSEVMPGFNAALTALRDLIGPELMWNLVKEAANAEEAPKVVIN